MLKPIIYPYKIKSGSATILQRALGTFRVYADRNYYHHPNHLVINWGNSSYPTWELGRVQCLNLPDKVALACNKRFTFNALLADGVPHPDWTDCKERAQSWVEEGHKVFCRKSLTSHSGKGIVIASTKEELVDAPLYVQAVKKDKEYRVHVFQGQIIDCQLKRKKNGFEGGTAGIRNHSNGWVYTRGDVQLPDNVGHESVRAVESLGLHFGAVDICTDLDNNSVVFEVNTAPGLYGTTLTKYVEAIKRLL